MYVCVLYRSQLIITVHTFMYLQFLIIQDFDALFSADSQFKLYYRTGKQCLGTAQRQKAKVLLESSLEIINKCSDEVKQSLEHQYAKLYFGVVNRYS